MSFMNNVTAIEFVSGIVVDQGSVIISVWAGHIREILAFRLLAFQPLNGRLKP